MSDYEEYRELLTALYGTPRAIDFFTVPRHLGIIVDGNTELSNLLIRCLTTGASGAKEAARKVIIEILNEMDDEADEMIYAHDPDERWDHMVESVEHPIVWNRVLRDWNLTNVLDELGYPMSEVDAISSAKSLLESTIYVASPQEVTIAQDDAYWRGVAAIVMARGQQTQPMLLVTEDFPDYINWAGHHADLKSAVTVAAERASFHRDTLQGILEQGDTTALRNGVL